MTVGRRDSMSTRGIVSPHFFTTQKRSLTNIDLVMSLLFGKLIPLVTILFSFRKKIFNTIFFNNYGIYIYSIYSSALSCVTWRSGYCTITIQSRLLPRIFEEIPLNVSSIRSSLPSAQAKSSYMWGESRRQAGFTEPMSDRSLASCIKHLPDLTECCTYPLMERLLTETFLHIAYEDLMKIMNHSIGIFASNKIFTNALAKITKMVH